MTAPTHQALCPTCGSITASVRKALRVKTVKCAPTTISPLMIWIEHDTQLVRDLADKVLVLQPRHGIGIGLAAMVPR